MWFIRVLLPLYAAFFVCTLLEHGSGKGFAYIALLVGCMATAMGDMVVNDTIVLHSVPMFALGVITSRFRQLGVARMCMLIVGIGMVTSLTCFCTSHPVTGFVHSFFDYPVVALIVLTVSVKRLDWHLMPLLAAIIFDLYLVHFKVYTVMSEHIPLVWFVTLGIPASVAVAWLFMRLRTSLTKVTELKRLWLR